MLFLFYTLIEATYALALILANVRTGYVYSSSTVAGLAYALLGD